MEKLVDVCRPGKFLVFSFRSPARFRRLLVVTLEYAIACTLHLNGQQVEQEVEKAANQSVVRGTRVPRAFKSREA